LIHLDYYSPGCFKQPGEFASSVALSLASANALPQICLNSECATNTSTDAVPTRATATRGAKYLL
jgi:hypothetical protein